MKLENLVAVVTGGASGLGEATCQCLSEAKCKVVVADLNKELGEALIKTLKTEAIFVQVDVSSEESIKSLMEQTVAHFGAIHIVVNCAGIINATPIVSSRGVASSAEFLRVFNINVVGTFNVSKYAAQQMMKQSFLNEAKEKGVIINVASVAGFEGQRGQVIYGGSKGAIIGMTLPMARDLGKYGIRVMTLAPGVFITPMGKGLNPKIQKTLEDQTALGRLGVAREFGDAVVSLVVNSYMTGTTVRLDGGIRLSHI